MSTPSLPKEIRATIHEDAIQKVSRFFNATTAECLNELLQNSRRSAPPVWTSPSRPTPSPSPTTDGESRTPRPSPSRPPPPQPACGPLRPSRAHSPAAPTPCFGPVAPITTPTLALISLSGPCGAVFWPSRGQSRVYRSRLHPSAALTGRHKQKCMAPRSADRAHGPRPVTAAAKGRRPGRHKPSHLTGCTRPPPSRTPGLPEPPRPARPAHTSNRRQPAAARPEHTSPPAHHPHPMGKKKAGPLKAPLKCQ